MTADVYTLIVSDKGEFDLMRESARRNGDVEHTGVLDGYYLLDNDVEYNGAFTSMTDTGEIWSVNNALKAARGITPPSTASRACSTVADIT